MKNQAKQWKYKPIHDPQKTKAFLDTVASAIVDNLNRKISKK